MHETIISVHSIPQLADINIYITRDPTNPISRREKARFDRQFNKDNNKYKYIIARLIVLTVGLLFFLLFIFLFLFLYSLTMPLPSLELSSFITL